MREKAIRFAAAAVLATAGLLGGYYAAYTGIRVELASKAEGRNVDQIDIRLARMEATINERFATRDDLAQFKNEIVSRLTAIETKMGK